MDSAKDLHSVHPTNRHLQEYSEVLDMEESGRSLALSWLDCLTILYAAVEPLMQLVRTNIGRIYTR